MDNHRAALWCWLQELDLNAPHSLFHIDRHTDTLQSRLDEWMKHLPSWSSSLEEYLTHSYKFEMGTVPVIRWDNYLSIYFEEFGAKLDRCYFATHRDGDDPNHDRVSIVEFWDLPRNLEYWLRDRDVPWIVNIDLDYFFWNSGENTGVMVSDDYLKETFTPLRHAIDDGTVAVTTICLTPDPPLTSGWKATEKLAAELLAILGMDFKLPKEPSNNTRHADH
ncbi:MAG: UPF0489 family protein [Pseudomonadota bacterium]